MFFRVLNELLLQEGHCQLVEAIVGDRAVASSLYCHFGKQAVFKYGASDPEFHQFKPNNLIMSESLRWYREHGYERLSFGRTHIDNPGLVRYKKSWGTRQEDLTYYQFGIGGRSPSISHRVGYKGSDFLKHLPVPILRIAGRLFYAHFG